jgi:hypothetical protein
MANSDIRWYSQQTAMQTLSELRADILQGKIPKEAKAVFETKAGNNKPRTLEGTLIKCAFRYPVLANLYTPVRRYARSGMKYGILAGIIIQIAMLGFVVYQTNQTFGLIIIAYPICLAIAMVGVGSNIKIPVIPTLCMLAVIFIPYYLGSQGLFPMLLGAAFSGGLLYSMPGMTIGAIIGTIRRPRLTRAFDAPHENAMLRIAIPLVVAIVLWTTYFFWARSYFQAP